MRKEIEGSRSPTPQLNELNKQAIGTRSLRQVEEESGISHGLLGKVLNGTQKASVDLLHSQYLIYGGAIVIFGAVAFIYTKKRKKKPATDMPEEEDPWDDYDDETEDTEMAEVPDGEKTETEEDE